MRQYDNIPKNMLQRLVSNVKEKLASVAFSGKLSDAENDTNFRPIIHTTKQEYEALPEDKLTDGKVYLTEDESPESNVVGLVDINEAINGVVLWENPNPSAEFPAQTVTLDDNIEKYDHFEIGLKINKDNLSYYGSIKADLKYGSTQFITFSNEYNYIRSFSIEQSNFIFENAYRRNDYGNISDSLISNNILIPYKIIGYPKADFNSIDGILPSAQNVSYDNTTSGLTAENVQDAVDEISLRNAFSFDEVRIGTWLDGKSLYRKMINFGTLQTGSKEVEHNVPNVDHIHIDTGSSYFYINDMVSYSVPYHEYVTSTYASRTKIAVISAIQDPGIQSYKAIICIEYTKTTD